MPLIGHASPAGLQDEESLFLAHVLQVGMAFQFAEKLTKSNVLLVAQVLVGEQQDLVFPKKRLDLPGGPFVQGSQLDPVHLGPQ